MWNLQLVSPSPVAKFSSDVVPAKSNDLCGNTHRERERERPLLLKNSVEVWRQRVSASRGHRNSSNKCQLGGRPFNSILEKCCTVGALERHVTDI